VQSVNAVAATLGGKCPTAHNNEYPVCEIKVIMVDDGHSSQHEYGQPNKAISIDDPISVFVVF